MVTRISDPRLPDWPGKMCAKTLAAYLDFVSTASFYRKLKKDWDDFPPQSPVTDKWHRRNIDEWLAAKHGLCRDIPTQRAHLESELGLGKS